MAHLTLAGLSEDGQRLLLVDDRGAEFTVTVDHALRSALRGEHARLGQLEIHMDASLRPRDIQARIRAGETPEAVAQAASTTVDRIMAYAAPVLAERAHIADRAQRASIRRSAGESGGARVLGDAVQAHLVGLNVSSDSVEWDAWRREDGKWVLTGIYATGERAGSASFSFDAPGNYVIAENDDARWLVGDPVGSARASAPRAPRSSRRLSAVAPEDELPLGEDALEMVHEEEPAPQADDTQADDAQATESTSVEDSPFLVRALERQNAPEPVDEPEDEPVDQPIDGAAPVDDQAVHESGSDPSDSRAPEPEEPSAPKRTTKKRGRASVPSWDEIMFGGGDQD